MKRKGYSGSDINEDVLQTYLQKTIIEKKLSKSKLDQAVAALNFRYYDTDKMLLQKLKAPKKYKTINKMPHYAYTIE